MEGAAAEAPRRQTAAGPLLVRLEPGRLRKVVAETGICSSLSLQLSTDPEGVVSLGALDPYSPEPRSFDADTRGEAVALAAHAAIALQGAQTETHLRSGMVTRTVIGQAEGILMERL